MRNPQGTPIWYELMTTDAEGAKAFYGDVVGWTFTRSPGPVEYHLLGASDGPAGGMLPMVGEMLAGGAKPGWLMYVGVDDVDATAEQARGLGAQIHVPPTDIPDVGRFSLMADPQGALVYIMRGSVDAPSTAFAPKHPGHVAWNELWTTDRKGALAFYGALFGWENRETMEMPNGGYHFLDLGDRRLGALAEMNNEPPAWTMYVQVADLDAALARARNKGAAIFMGPHEVPTGERIVIGTDPQGARFALVG